MPRARRVDNNQAEIVALLRDVPGVTVQHLHTVGNGCPDIAVGFRGFTYFFEIKSENGTLTEDEQRWHEEWTGQVGIIYSAEDALRMMGAIE